MDFARTEAREKEIGDRSSALEVERLPRCRSHLDDGGSTASTRVEQAKRRATGGRQRPLRRRFPLRESSVFRLARWHPRRRPRPRASKMPEDDDAGDGGHRRRPLRPTASGRSWRRKGRRSSDERGRRSSSTAGESGAEEEDRRLGEARKEGGEGSNGRFRLNFLRRLPDIQRPRVSSTSVPQVPLPPPKPMGSLLSRPMAAVSVQGHLGSLQAASVGVVDEAVNHNVVSGHGSRSIECLLSNGRRACNGLTGSGGGVAQPVSSPFTPAPFSAHTGRARPLP